MKTLSELSSNRLDTRNAFHVLNTYSLPKSTRQRILNSIFLNSRNELMNRTKYSLNMTKQYKMLKNLYPAQLERIKPRNAETLLILSPNLRKNKNLVARANRTNFRDIKNITTKEKQLLKLRNQWRKLKQPPPKYSKHQFNGYNSNDYTIWWNMNRMLRSNERMKIKTKAKEIFPKNFVNTDMFSKKDDRTVLNIYRKSWKSSRMTNWLKL